MEIQGNCRLVQVWSAGGSFSGSSSVQVVTSISSGKSAFSNINALPHCVQKPRVAFALEANFPGVPCVNRNWLRGTLNHATSGAPLARRQVAQWQMVRLKGVPPASNRMAPHKHPPVRMETPVVAPGMMQVFNAPTATGRASNNSFAGRNNGLRPADSNPVQYKYVKLFLDAHCSAKSTAPGFKVSIAIHSHSSATLMIDPLVTSRRAHGVPAMDGC